MSRTHAPVTNAAPPAATDAWHARDAQDALQALSTDAAAGLSEDEAAARRARVGPNRLPAARRRTPLQRFALQFHNPLIYVLLVAAGITMALDDWVDAGVILGVVLVNAIIGFVQEGRAEQALEAVRSMLAHHAWVVRSGRRLEVDVAGLVPGDIVAIESGMRVPADLRLLRVHNLSLDESALTGESVPVPKGTAPVAAGAPLAERSPMAYSGTVVATGTATGVVVATGTHTEIGRIGTLVSRVESLATPLTQRLDEFARRITVFILAVGAVTFAYGHFAAAMPSLDVFLAVVGLAVAAIPEGLPAVVTIVLAIGTRTLARNHAIVRRLPAVETLGSVSVICTDKTGTLTRNEMTAVAVALPDLRLTVTGVGYAPEGHIQLDGVDVDPMHQPTLRALAECAVLCNDAHLHRDGNHHWHVVGDPTEAALLTLGLKAGLSPQALQAEHPRIDAIPFESERRFMATLHARGKAAVLLLKGAPETVLARCDTTADGAPINRAAWLARVESDAAAGQRVLALARAEMPQGTTRLHARDVERGLQLLGLVGLIDPPREDAISAVAECRAAGVRVVMITGDHATTAAAIGRQLGLQVDRALTGSEIDRLDDAALGARMAENDIVARASPEHKLRLIRALKAQGRQVAMTGDGVNDAPALKAADIGVAMGEKGTDAARQAADIVLADDRFATIAQAVREGRVVFDNIKKALLFILPTNGGEAGVILMAIFAGLALPVTARQILWVNMVTAVTLALALAFEPAEPGVMRRPPRPPEQPLVTRALGARIAYVTALMIAATFFVFEWELGRGSSLETARTAAVNMLVFGEIVYLFNVRRFTASSLDVSVLYGNRVALGMSALLVALQLLYTYAPPLQSLFASQGLDALSWLMIAALGAIKFLAVEAEKALLRRLRIHAI